MNRRALILWSLAALLVLPGFLRLDRLLRPTSPVSGTESAIVEQALASSFDSPFSNTAILVVTGLPRIGPDTAGWRARIRELLAPFTAVTSVTGMVSPATSLDTLLASQDGRTAIALVGVTGPEAIDSLRAVTARFLPRWRAGTPAITARWTGQLALIEDLRVAGIRSAREAEWRAIPVMALVAIWALGVTGAALALLAATFAILVTLGAVGSFGFLFPPALTIRLLVPLVGLALTVDYTLYLRRRGDEGVPRRELLRTIALAAGVVSLAFAALGLAPTGELRAAARGGALIAVLSAVAAVTLTSRSRRDPLPNPVPPSPHWVAWGNLVVRHSWLVILTTAIPVGLLARHAFTARLVTPLSDWLPAGMESADAAVDIERAGRSGTLATLRVLLEFPAGEIALSEPGWATLQRTVARIRELPGVADARALSSIGTGELFLAQRLLPSAVTRSYVSRDGRIAIIDVVPDVSESPTVATDLVAMVRARADQILAGTSGARLSVGGLPAYVMDYAAAVRRTLPAVIASTTLVTMIVLLFVLRAPLLVLKAVLLNLLVAAAAIGATVLVFQDGVGLSMLGIRPLGAVLPTVPLLAFGAVFGVSMDYELFLLSGVIEEKRTGSGDGDAIVNGLARTGPLITRAAAIMIALFLAFAMSSLIPLAMIGFALAAAVFIDATIVRMALAPAILYVAGRWNWWPGYILRR